MTVLNDVRGLRTPLSYDLATCGRHCNDNGRRLRALFSEAVAVNPIILALFRGII